ncbi:hypothetical protein [Arenicella chitinivorans]|uniref:hypothetical protein n=1 Tax=Arenicella chitinivorans TaxID=1329800 RepID=UPI001E4FEA98|nr:hypothetical protein [Arenicella chitinivorans]
MTIAMLFGLIVLRPTPWRHEPNKTVALPMVVISAFLLSVCGLWNVGYGVVNLTAFWGWAALLSGVTMVIAAAVIFLYHGQAARVTFTWVDIMKPWVTALLAGFFLLYSVTLVQLNLGYSIIG